MGAARPDWVTPTPETGDIAFCVRGVISPLLSNIYLNGVDRMLEKARAVTRTAAWSTPPT